MNLQEPAVAYNRKDYSIEEYLALETDALEKSEYYRGEIFAMAGTLLPHSTICSNLLVQMGSKLLKKGCRPHSSDLRIHIPSNTLFTYPDLSVFCGKVETLNNDQFNALNPIVLIEVLSKNRRSYDRGTKFSLYRDIPTLKEYVVIDSLSVKVEAWRINNNGHWELTEYKSQSESLPFPALHIEINVSEIYADAGLTDATLPSIA